MTALTHAELEIIEIVDRAELRASEAEAIANLAMREGRLRIAELEIEMELQLRSFNAAAVAIMQRFTAAARLDAIADQLEELDPSKP